MAATFSCLFDAATHIFGLSQPSSPQAPPSSSAPKVRMTTHRKPATHIRASASSSSRAPTSTRAKKTAVRLHRQREQRRLAQGPPLTPTTLKKRMQKRSRTRKQNQWAAQAKQESLLSKESTYWRILRNGKQYRSLVGASMWKKASPQGWGKVYRCKGEVARLEEVRL